MNIPKPETQIMVFQTIDAAATFLWLCFGNRDDAFHQVQLLQGIKISGRTFNSSGLFDLIQARFASRDGLQNREVIARLAQLLLEHKAHFVI